MREAAATGVKIDLPSIAKGTFSSTFSVLSTSLKTMISPQLTGFGGMTVDG
eukprot:COSAG02_NODE_49761_length_325_cov_0.256637_1_plen_50_part_10